MSSKRGQDSSGSAGHVAVGNTLGNEEGAFELEFADGDPGGLLK